MKKLSSIHENELDGALNALFLETYSHREDEQLARFVLDQEYDAVMQDKNKKKLLRKLNTRRRGFLLLALIGLIVTILLPIYFSITDKKGQTHFPVRVPAKIENLGSDNPTGNSQIAETPSQEQAASTRTTSDLNIDRVEMLTANDTSAHLEHGTRDPKEVRQNDSEAAVAVAENKKKILSYFDKAGLQYFGQVKADLLNRIRLKDEQLYTRIEPGATVYKNREMLVAPFVMSNFPVTNLQYKAFLADLFRQNKMSDLEKCLPKQEVWNEYSCNKLAENYFMNESYNYFPVVNISKEAMLIFCNWMEEEMNKTLAGSKQQLPLKGKVSGAKKEVIVRLPYDYEWIYAADASYAIIPDCGGYNTIYDPSEGLVSKSFFKRTSQLSKHKKKKMNRIDQLNDLNRFGMSENEMMAIYKEALNFSAKKSDPTVAFSFEKLENCCLAGHVVEVINTRDGDTTLRGCCWKDKEEYLKMANDYKKFDASPFVGFRVMLITKNGTYKDPFW